MESPHFRKSKNIVDPNVEKELRTRLCYEKMLADVSSLAISVKDLGEFMDSCLERMGKSYDTSRIYIYKRKPNSFIYRIISEWVAEGVGSGQELDYVEITIPWATEILMEGRVIDFEDTEEISGEEEKAITRMSGVLSIIVVPLFIKETLYGFMGFDECRYHREWKDEDKYVLSTAGQIISQAIENKQVEEELANQQSRLTAIFRSVNEAIITVDMDMKVMEANPFIKEICAVPAEKIIGKTLREGIIPCLGSCQDALEETLRSKGTIREHQIKCSHHHKKRQTVVVTSSPLVDDKGAFLGAVMAIRDITRLRSLERELKERYQFQNIIGKSVHMQKLFSLIEDLADLETTVLISGESGTGKELVAKALHHVGNRAFRPFITVNCSALSPYILESELFGHVKGAFTGAVANKKGRFEMAQGGTLLLDEIGDISHVIQLKLLRVLQEKEFERVGESNLTRVDVRIIASTNQNLRHKVVQGLFREDLYYRLNVMELKLPPLRERLEDLPLLVTHFCRIYNEKHGKQIAGISDQVMKMFMSYSWPGNIRELEHAIEHAFVLCRGRKIQAADIPSEIKRQPIKPKKLQNKKQIGEPRQILDTLKQTDGNKAKAARLLGIDRSTLYRKIYKYRLLKSGRLSRE
jgi:two-component system response regulator HydG